MIVETTKLGKRGTVVIPVGLRKRFVLKEGSTMIAEERSDGILLKPAATFPVETYSAERKAEFLLSNASNVKDYSAASKAVKAMGLDPKKIPHYKFKK